MTRAGQRKQGQAEMGEGKLRRAVRNEKKCSQHGVNKEHGTKLQLSSLGPYDLKEGNYGSVQAYVFLVVITSKAAPISSQYVALGI